MTVRNLLLAIGIYSLATVIFLYPLPIHMGDRIFENGDSYLTLWIFSWETHALSHSPGDFWNGNIFYPEANTLALSEVMLPVLPIFAAMRLLTANPLIAYNATLLITFPLSALSMLVLVNYLTRRFPAALIAGFIYGFTPIRLAHLHHVQLESLMWLPLLFLFFHRWLAHGRWKDAIITGVLFATQYLTTVYTALYSIPVFLVWFGLHFGLERRMPARKTLLQALTAAGLSAAILTPFVLKYQQLSDWNAKPQESLKVFFSSDLWWNLLATFPTNFLYGGIFHRFSAPPFERFYFTGFTVVILAMSSLWLWRNRAVQLAIAAAAVSFIFALGPFLQISTHVTNVSLPYHWFFDRLPGLVMLRVPARSGLITLTLLTVLCAFGWLALAKRVRISEGMFAGLTLLLLSVEFFSAPIPLLPEVSGKGIPQAYEYLKQDAETGGVLEIPTHAQLNEAQGFTDRVYTYFSAYHFKPIVVGYSGYFPPSFEALIAATKDLPANEPLDLFEAIGVRTIVLHTKYFDTNQKQRWEDAIESGRRLAKLAEFEDGSEVLSLKPTLKISKDLNALNWSVTVGEARNGIVPITLHAGSLRDGNIDYVVNPELPRVTSSRIQATWRDGNNRIVDEQTVRARLPYVLNHASVETNLKTPYKSGQYLLELQVLESPPLSISTTVSIFF